MFTLNGKYTNATIYADIVEQAAISQVQGLCNHPVFKDASIRIMPDVHAGEGCTIGTTIINKNKMIIPNIVGVDISCGVLTTIFKCEKEIDFKALDDFIVDNIPNGMNVRESEHKQMKKEVKECVETVVRNLNFGDATKYLNSVGSLGGGNHYIEIGRIDENTYALSIHTGSRTIGKKVCEYFQRKGVTHMEDESVLKEKIKKAVDQLIACGRKHDINMVIEDIKKEFYSANKGIPRELAFIRGKDYDDYVENMILCSKIASENRRLIAYDIIKFLGVKEIESFDTVHNYIEQLDNGDIVIRKGAVSAKKGEKLAIPLNMKDGVIICVGKGNEEWNCSAPHGAGRMLSRSAANEKLSLDDFTKDMEGVQTWSVCRETLDESPAAYKPAESILNCIKDTVDIECIVKPIYNFKAHTKQISWAEIKRAEKEAKRKMNG